MFRRLLVVVLLAVSFHAQDRRTFTVPFELRSSLIQLKGQLNGKPSAFLLDTGANNSMVDVHTARFDSCAAQWSWLAGQSSISRQG